MSRSLFKKVVLSTAVASGSLLAGQALAATAIVTNGMDSGEGSLRAAIEAGATTIVVDTMDDIQIMTPLSYAGTEPLMIYGSGQTVSTMENINILEMTGGASLTVVSLNLQGPGGFSIESRGDQPGPAGKGIFIDVADGQTGTVYLTLSDVTVSDVANHGIHVSDCDLADDCGGGGGGAGGGSPASVAVVMNNVTVDNVGQGKFDADGLRVDERGEGNVTMKAYNSLFTRVGADGIELDEGQAGTIFTDIVNTDFTLNGNYCDPAVLGPFIPDPDEGEFEDGTTTEDDIPGPVEGSPGDQCIEREVDFYDSGFVEEYAFGIDLDDGIDLDEAGPGSIVSLMAGGTIVDNLDEGMDYDEEGEGSIITTMAGVDAANNTDDGYKFTEEDEGAMIGWMVGSTATDNGGKGAVFEEAGDGDLIATVENSTTSGNDDGDTSIEAVQEDAGTGTLRVTGSSLAEPIEVDGVELIEE